MRVQGSGFRVQGAGFRVQGLGFRVEGSGFKVQGSGFRVRESGSRLPELRIEAELVSADGVVPPAEGQGKDLFSRNISIQ